MIAALDVHYNQTPSLANAAAVVFNGWGDADPAAEYTAGVTNVQSYVPGEFFRRELPCLLAVIERIQEPLSVLIVDGYVRLHDGPGLGEHLFERFGKKIPVIGVAKTRFHGASAMEVFRGGSKSPLHVTAIGMEAQDAAERVREMHGTYRIPALLKRVDRLARGMKNPS